MPIQKITLSEPLIINNNTLKFTIQYESDTPEVAYLGLALHYNSTQLELVKVEDILLKDLRFPNPNSPNFPGGSRLDEGNKDNDESTDQLFLTSWSTPAQTWPGQNKINLYTITFKVPEGRNINDPNFNPTINFTAQGSQGFTLEFPGDGNIPAPKIQKESQNQSLNKVIEKPVNQDNISPVHNNSLPVLSDLSTMLTLIISAALLILIP